MTAGTKSRDWFSDSRVACISAIAAETCPDLHFLQVAALPAIQFPIVKSNQKY